MYYAKRCRWREAALRPPLQPPFKVQTTAYEIVEKDKPMKPESPGAFTSHTETSRHYQSGFAADFASEALPGALPLGRNSPQRVNYGLYAEQLSGTAFTAPRGHNRRSWLYRIRPAAVHQPFTQIEADDLRAKLVANFADVPPTPPNQLRWDRCRCPTRPRILSTD